MQQEILHQAIQLIKKGDKKSGKELLLILLKEYPQDANIWLWLTPCYDSTERKIYCLRKALEIDPNNEKGSRNLFSVNSSQKYPSFFNNCMTCQHNNVFRSATPR